MALQVLNKIPTTITIDDEPVRLRVRRLTKAESVAFKREASDCQPKGEETDETRKRREQLDADFQERIIRQFITVEPGDIIGDEGENIVTGDQLFEKYCSREDVIAALSTVIYAENFLGKAKKNALRDQHVFSPGSRPSIVTQAGAEPVPTAAPVESSTSVSDEAATDNQEESQSGDTATSS